MPEPQQTRSPYGAIATLVAAGALGFHLGIARFPHWQVPVETAQVLAGVVEYPRETPFYVYHVKLWTLLHQVCAIFLWFGTSEIALSRVLSGVLGMLSLQALAMCAYAAGARVLLAAGAAVVIFVSEVTYAGAVYPIFLMGVPFTYGVIGLSLIVLVAALIGSGLQRTGAFLLGLAPAVHPSLALWLWAIVGATALLDRATRDALRSAAASLLAGAALAAASLGVHLVMAAGVPAEAVESSRKYFDAFVAMWDGHRRPIKFSETGVRLNIVALAITTVWLRWFREELTPPAPILLRFVQASAIAAIVMVPVSWVPPRQLPMPVVMLMPGRVLNIAVLAAPALLIGLLGASRSAWRRALLLLLLAALLLGDASMLWRLFPDARPHWLAALETHRIVLAAAAALLAGAALERWRGRRRVEEPSRLQLALFRIAGIGAGLAVAAGAAIAYRVPEQRQQIFIDRTNSATLAAAAAGRGLLLAAGDAHLTQLRTRRPLLIDTGGLDAVAYMPETGPGLFWILRDIYGVDLFNPPPEARGAGALPASAHRQRWERYTVDDWRNIRRTYHVTQVLTDAGWQLALPIVAGDRRFLLHDIPE